jgi:hypothetical protein
MTAYLSFYACAPVLVLAPPRFDVVVTLSANPAWRGSSVAWSLPS